MENIIEEFDDIIVNKSEFTSEELIKASKKVIFKQTLSFSIIGAILMFLGLIFLIVKLVNKLDNTYLILIIVLLLCGGLIVALPFVVSLFMPSIMKKQNQSIYNGFRTKVIFSEDNIDCTVESDDAKNSSKISYNLVYSVKIIDDVVYMYMNSNVLYMFKLSGFRSENDKNKALGLLLKQKVK